MGKIDYKKIYDENRHGWYAMTEEPQKYEALLAGHYSDSNHFIYELLQNAEDERADHVVFEYYPDKLVFYHNGDPFDEEDVRGVSSMLMGTKDRTDAQTIGRFGMGFKSVFKYTYMPEIYSDDEAFRIEKYLLPVEIKKSWNYKKAIETLGYPVNTRKKYRPFASSEHLTKIIIPFEKLTKERRVEKISGRDVLQKLESLPPEILIFLTYIKNLYWIDRPSGKYSRITLDTDDTDNHLVICKVLRSNYKNERVTRFLKFNEKFDHPEMKGAEVSVAYKVNNRAQYSINEMQGENIWVYFPTKESTDLPFMVHGSFETAVSREKLMDCSDFNDCLFDHLGDLVSGSMLELKKRNLITQTFLRRILLNAFRDEENNHTIPGLKKKVTRLFCKEPLLPDREGRYYRSRDLLLPVPFALADFCEDGRFVAFNNEKESNFTEYFNWLKDDLKIRLFTIEDWAAGINKEKCTEKLDQSGINRMKKIYSFLDEYKVSAYSTVLSYSRSGSYEQTIRNVIGGAWDRLRQAPMILNAENRLVPAYEGDMPCVYLSSSSEFKKVLKESIVKSSFAKEFRSLFEEGFGICDFDNYQYVKEHLLEKYISPDDGRNIVRINPDEYIEDLKQIMQLFDKADDLSNAGDLIRESYILKAKNGAKEDVFERPGNIYVLKSEEGIDLQVYFDSIETKYCALDARFYKDYGITEKKLYRLGILLTPVEDGIRLFPGGNGVASWTALGDYCPEMTVKGLEENLRFIEGHPDELLAKKKSREVFKLLLAIRNKLSGKTRYRKINPIEKEEENRIFSMLKTKYAWVYDKNHSNHRIADMSKYELDTELYGELLSDKSVYESLGFIEKDEDKSGDAYDLVCNLDVRDQQILLRQLARKFKLELRETEDEDAGVDDSLSFRAGKWVSSDFPVSRIRDKKNLEEHVRQQFYYADPVTYEKVRRQVRTSRSRSSVKAYVEGMYSNSDNVKICQMCKKPADRINAVEIANFGIELPQLNLCLCSKCMRKYQTIKEQGKARFRKKIREAIKNTDISEGKNIYEIDLNGKDSISFTQTHMAELQEIFKLLRQYGKSSQS